MSWPGGFSSGAGRLSRPAQGRGETQATRLFLILPLTTVVTKGHARRSHRKERNLRRPSA
jgi:hypothetical protein